MNARIRSALIVTASLLASLGFTAGGARAALITEFDGSFTSTDANGTNTAISTLISTYQAGDGTQSVFFLKAGGVSATQANSDFVGAQLNELQIDLTPFTTANAFVSITNAISNPDSPDPTLLEAVGTGGQHADFTMASTASITTDLANDRATIAVGVTLRASSKAPGDDLSAFNAAGGGTFTITIDNADITPSGDGHIKFPVHAGAVTVTFGLAPTIRTPAPASVCLLLTGVVLLAGGALARGRRPRAALAA